MFIHESLDRLINLKRDNTILQCKTNYCVLDRCLFMRQLTCLWNTYLTVGLCAVVVGLRAVAVGLRAVGG